MVEKLAYGGGYYDDKDDDELETGYRKDHEEQYQHEFDRDPDQDFGDFDDHGSAERYEDQGEQMGHDVDHLVDHGADDSSKTVEFLAQYEWKLKARSQRKGRFVPPRTLGFRWPAFALFKELKNLPQGTELLPYIPWYYDDPDDAELAVALIAGFHRNRDGHCMQGYRWPVFEKFEELKKRPQGTELLPYIPWYYDDPDDAELAVALIAGFHRNRDGHCMQGYRWPVFEKFEELKKRPQGTELLPYIPWYYDDPDDAELAVALIAEFHRNRDGH